MGVSVENLQKLEQQQIIWLACVRPDGRPHLTPVWFIFYDEMFYIATDPKNVKVRNLKLNPRAALALEDGVHPLICEATGRQIGPAWDEEIVKRFKQKYDWDLTTEEKYHDLWEFIPKKWLSW
jgi:F420H(2)-dependent biliverdin reductase